MSRVRQFSAQRQFNTPNLSHSKKNLNSPNLNSSRVEKYQIATPKSNKQSQNQLSSSRKSQYSSSSQYICVGCFNHKLSSDKKLSKLDESRRARQQQKYQIALQKRQDPIQQLRNTRLLKQANQMNQINRKLMQEKRNDKQKQKQVQNLLNQQYKNSYESYLRQVTSKSLEKQKQKQQFRNQVQKQIQQKSQRKRQQQYLIQEQDMRRTNQLLDNATEDQYFKEKQRKQNQYRQQITKQIQQRRKRQAKQQQQQHNVQNLGIGIAQAAYQRQLQRHKQLQKRKQQLLIQARSRKVQAQKKLYEQKLRQQRLNESIVEQQFKKRQIQQQNYLNKQRQTQQYLNDLKRQLQTQKIKKFQEYQFQHRPTNTSIQIVQKKVLRKQCRSCEKKFPKTFLTKVK